MLTRLRVKGFKNLRDIDLHFGQFTCIAGPNGVGKSNLFDAITLLSDLARKPLVEAIAGVRGTNGRMNEIGALFGPVFDGELPSIEWVADIIVPRTAVDDFDRSVKPTATFLEYTLRICFDQALSTSARDPVYIDCEELRAKSSSDAAKWLPFHPGKTWIVRHVFGPGPRTTPFIRTDLDAESGLPTIKLAGDKSRGRPFGVPARRAPQTVVSTVNSVSHPTALAARNEMRSWRLLQLEPSALRRPDELSGSPRISAVGEHLPAALGRIGSHGEVARRLAELVPGVVSVDVDADKIRETRTLRVVMRDRRAYPASALSDGTLRFLALAIMASDPEASGLMCMEEPENGIHPSRVDEMIRLIRSLADDEEEGSDVPLDRAVVRQVMINTHSPLVVGHLPDDSLLIAETLRQRGKEFVNFKPMPKTWRAAYGDLKGNDTVTRGELEKYLNGVQTRPDAGRPRQRTVADHLTGDLFAAQ